MKVKFLINSLTGGGAERQAQFLLNNLSFSKLLLWQNEIRYEIPHDLPRKILMPFKKGKLLQLPYVLWRLFVESRQTHKILSFLEWSNFANILIALISPTHRAFISVRTCPSYQYQQKKDFLQRWLIKKLYPHAEKIITNSAGAKWDLQHNFQIPSAKVDVIPNGLDLTQITKLSEVKLSEEEESYFKRGPVLINSGRLVKGKGLHELIQLFAEVRQYYPQLRLLLLGDGPLSESLQALAKSLQLRIDEDIFFLGFCKNPYQLIARADLFIFTSYWEGLPNVLIESLAVGTPVISADCPFGPREIMGVSIQQDIRYPYYNAAGALLPSFSFSDQEEEKAEKMKIWRKSLIHILGNKKQLHFDSRHLIAKYEMGPVLDLWRETLFHH